MNILITGGTGFIGRSIIDGLKNRYHFFSPTRNELDLFDSNKIRRFILNRKIDIIIHSAVGKDNTILSDTLRMFFSVAKNASLVKKIIHFGSGAEYGKSRNLIKVKESEFGSVIPTDDYGFAKYICSHSSQAYKNIVTLRLFGIYGKYENYLIKFISNTIAKRLYNIPIIIKQNVIFDYLFIDDLISIMNLFISSTPKHNYYNITPTDSITLREIVNILQNITNNRFKYSIQNKGFNYQYTGSNKLLLSEFSNIHFTSYYDGILNLYEHYKSNLSLIDASALKKDDYIKVKSIKK